MLAALLLVVVAVPRVPAAESAGTTPAIAPPPGASGLVRDACANFWVLVPVSGAGNRPELQVLPAQAATTWVTAQIPGLPPARWETIVPQTDRAILVSGDGGTWRFDPRSPEKGANQVAGGASTGAGQVIGSSSQAAGGSGPVAVNADQGVVDPSQGPGHLGKAVGNPSEVGADVSKAAGDPSQLAGRATVVASAVSEEPGNSGQVTGNSSRAAARGATPAAAATPWRAVARMPASNHDLTAATVGGRVYIAGGVTSDFGFPARSKAFDQMWELDPQGWSWRVAASFARPRIYCATVAFGERVWVLGGDVLHEDGQRRPTTLAEIFDPKTGALTPGPALPVALPAPLALVAAGRLWVVGARNRSERGQMASIGPGETTWRVEAEALPQMWALAGAAMDNKLYVCVPDTGLAMFDPATKGWTVIPGAARPRSAQVAAWRGELWIMGGCDQADWSETRIYNPTQRSWRSGPALPVPLAWGAAAVIEDQLVVTGGAALHGRPAGGNYVFSDQTFVLAREANSSRAAGALPRPSSLPRWSNAALRGTAGAGLPFATERVFPQFKFGRLGTILSVPPGAPDEPERLLVAEVLGPVWTFPNRADVAQPDRMLDLPERFKAATHTYALAFHPQYPKQPYVYVLYNRVQPKPAEDVLARFTVSPAGAPTIDWHSEQVILRWPSDGHNGGDVLFGPDGYLYVSAGDRSSPGDPQNTAQRVDLIAGGVLRIDVRAPEPGQSYSVPADNPFVGQPGVRPEFWAYGLRNPWRMWFSSAGELWLGDNGDDSWESVHLIRKGANYGWSVFEGSHPFKRNRTLAGPTPVHTPPVIELSHAEARSVIGGLEYRGSQYPSLVGQQIFGDFVTGSVWAFRWERAALRDYRRIADTRGSMIAFGTDRAGHILMAREDGQIHRLVEAARPAAPAAPAAEFPRLLSRTGLFSDTARETPAAGVIPYEINAEMWSDGARMRRFLAVSGVHPIATETGKETNWDLPDGSAVVRTLAIPTHLGPRRVETQLMYREQGTWQFYTYAWNESQTDAELVPAAGDRRAVAGLPNRTWRFGSRAECTICHTAATHSTLGLTTAQLNRDADFGPVGRRVENQIAALAESGLLRPKPNAASGALARKPTPTDTSLGLEQRARSYLDVNCAHCHRTGGVGGRAAFQLLDSIPLAASGVVNGRPLVPLLGPNSRIVSPQHPEESELMHRMRLKEGGRMPLLGSDVPDPDGIALIEQWIREMSVAP